MPSLEVKRSMARATKNLCLLLESQLEAIKVDRDHSLIAAYKQNKETIRHLEMFLRETEDL